MEGKRSNRAGDLLRTATSAQVVPDVAEAVLPGARGCWRSSRLSPAGQHVRALTAWQQRPRRATSGGPGGNCCVRNNWSTACPVA